MAMSDCPKCWETPCTCGYEYKDYSNEELINFIINVLSVHDKDNQIKVLEKVYELMK